MSSITKPLVVYLPDTRAVELSPFGIGNLKIGMGVHTYSRIAGNPALGNAGGTCPGSTEECERICYAKRIAGVVRMIYEGNSDHSDVPAIPEECRVLRIHISGDFDTLDYIASWYRRLKARPDVTAWAYTRSWRVPSLLPALEQLRRLPNLQMFASIDPTCRELPPTTCRTCHLGADNEQHLAACPDDCGAHDYAPFPWRRAWIDRSFDQAIKSGYPQEYRLMFAPTRPLGDGTDVPRLQINIEDQTSSYICPEETKHKANCLECGYCFEGKKNDVTFLEH